MKCIYSPSIFLEFECTLATTDNILAKYVVLELVFRSYQMYVFSILRNSVERPRMWWKHGIQILKIDLLAYLVLSFFRNLWD